MKITHIYWFANYNPSSPSVRYRIIYTLPYFKNMGISSSFVYPGYGFLNILHFIKIYLSVVFFRKKNSIIVFQKIHSARMYATLLKALLLFRSQNTLYDIDDAEYERHPSGTIHFFMRKCSACSAGSTRLLQYISVFNSNSFLQTSPVMQHDKIKIKRNQELVIGWIGFYNAHRKSLQELFYPALTDVRFPVRFVLIGVQEVKDRDEILSYFNDIKNIQIEFQNLADWEHDMPAYELISQFDIGVSPLLDTEMNRSKSAFKIKQYFSCGVPALGSPVGENITLISDGKNGFLCYSVQDYKERITEISSMNSSAYKQMQLHVLETRNNFSIENYCKNLVSFFESRN